MEKGIILKGISGVYTVYTDDKTIECKARGIFRKDNIKPLPGDNVITENDIITEIEERKNTLIRPAVANVDQLVFFLSVKSPAPDMILFDKMLLTAFFNKIKVVLCINKCDIDADDIIKSIRNSYKDCGIEIVELSALKNQGTGQLADKLNNKINVLAGQSGAGKSTTLNSIFEDILMETGSISQKNQRGKHTTRHSELFRFGNGYIADTPGFSSYDLNIEDECELANLYPEYVFLKNKCRYSECLHINEPDCEVKNALKNNLLDEERYKRYLRLSEEITLLKAKKYKR